MQSCLSRLYLPPGEREREQLEQLGQLVRTGNVLGVPSCSPSYLAVRRPLAAWRGILRQPLPGERSPLSDHLLWFMRAVQHRASALATRAGVQAFLCIAAAAAATYICPICRLLISSQSAPASYLKTAKRHLRDRGALVVCGLGDALANVVALTEMLKAQGLATVHEIHTGLQNVEGQARYLLQLIFAMSARHGHHAGTEGAPAVQAAAPRQAGDLPAQEHAV